ncbi:probable GPI-anchored adhesin-like protein PGA55 [Oryza sativa Japonica Group]|uniref:VWA domain containing protein n=1 Tax=Oryza sativa subsp. japonica TaxID=39947 RepID=H2B9Y0_ORYSJ|nr:uncharacterized protein LOC4347489 [Oryza sativa Japonica Group]AER52053.1 vWA domain containing protein [Oryza sativa Japonica Group]KAB8111193.1 hypothetical protein EE612_048770 [Oryza sativa]KAF2916909.1 hypothetical protein DAI22_09g154400 [Oryza sativa Japonica Group]
MEGEEGRKGKEALSGGHLCHVCGYQYPNANPSAKLRRSHRKNCGKAPAADEREEGEEVDADMERNAGEGLLPVRAGGGESEGNAGSPSLGSARGDADLVEVKEIAEHASPNVTGVQVITGYCSEAGVINCASHSDEISKEVGRPAEREDSLDEYQDASPFLHQPDSEVGAAVAHKSDFSIEEIKNLDSVSPAASVAANEISVEMDGVSKDQLSGQPNMTNLSGESIVGKEVEPTVMLESSDEFSVNVHSDNTYIVDSKPDKTSEFIGDVNGSTSFISDLTSQSTSPIMVESLMEDSMDALHIISEVSPSLEEKAGSANAESVTENSRIDFVQTEDQLKLTNAVNTLTDCSSQYKCVKDTLDAQLPVENPFLGNSVCSLDGHQSDHVVTNMDSMWGSDDEDICSEGIKAKGSELGFSCEENPQHVELVDKADENPSVEKPNGLSEEVVCSKEIGPEVPIIGQVSASQHVALLMDQVSTKNPFILDDTRSDDLFELPTENYHSEAQNVAESKLQVDFTPLPLDQLIIVDQTSIAEGQQFVISGDRVPAISSTCGNEPAVGTEDVSVSSTSDPAKNISLHDASVNNSRQEDGEPTSGINFVPSEVFLPAEFSTMPTSQDINALKNDGNEKTPLEDISTKDMTASLSEDNVEEKKETEGTSVKEMNSILKADNVEEEKLTDDTSAERNAMQHIDDAEKKQAADTVSRETSALQNIEERENVEGTGAKGVPAVGSLENADAENQTEDTSAKTECKSDNADNKKQSYDTSTEEMNAKNQAQDTSSKEMNTIQNTSNAEEKNQTEDPAVQEGNKQKEGISPTVAKQSSERVHVPLKVLLAEASVETKEKKTTAKERVLSFRRRVSKDDSSSAKSGSPKPGADDNKFWSSPARLPENNAEKKSKARKQPWMPFICCHSVH